MKKFILVTNAGEYFLQTKANSNMQAIGIVEDIENENHSLKKLLQKIFRN